VDQLLRSLSVVSPTESDFLDAVRLFRQTSLSHGVEFFDCLIAATAIRLGVAVQSRNVKHLAAIPGVSVVQPYP
jgi:predicted nucleic acid-binding protein